MCIAEAADDGAMIIAKKCRSNQQFISSFHYCIRSKLMLDSDKMGDNKDMLKDTAVIAITELVKEIESTRMRSDFCHFLFWKIHNVGFPREIVKKYDNFMICKFTTQSWKLIEIFVDHAVTIFNRCHPDQSIALVLILNTLLLWLELEYEQFLWEEQEEEILLGS